MPFPVPVDPDFRKELIRAWLDDVQDRVSLDSAESALESWKIANSLYLSLPPGQGDFSMEAKLVSLRVTIDQLLC